MKDTVISLFDVTGKMVAPWLDAGYECWIVDIQHPPAYETGGVTSEGRLHKVHWDLTKPWLCPVSRERIAFVSAFPPCDHLAVSGARWFRGKGLRRLAVSIEMFATAAEFCEWSGAPYFIENPVSNIASHWRKPDCTFHPYDFTAYESADNYTKRTCLWTGGGFVMPTAYRLLTLPAPDNRIHKCPPGPERHNIRSATPLGFSRAIFEANAPLKDIHLYV
jgi:hypothetical protein